MWRFFLWMFRFTFAADLVSDVKSGLKGKPVKIRRYPRSCKGLPKPPDVSGGFEEQKFYKPLF